ncbi:hypothetical protein HYG86_15325 [Alkalicella caledoniensis]|uniref:Uncharacterized protein n=1 Tax=Alkalicella caledoniensis TaxID=2731377 RepID=A0A7G9WBH8_ALKCA|nr:hypothetical protein [Alkalicella caledoniensis]QNO16040.1 hypothetical protein HYG86_15325 [Alkalicella caledoniensis]
MDKKRLVGIVVFIVVVGIFISHPQFKHNRESNRIETLLSQEKYQEVYDELNQVSHPLESWEYLALMRAEFYLDEIMMFNKKLEALIEKDVKGNVQLLVDEFGVFLIDYLALIDQMGGINFNDDVLLSALSQSYYYQWVGTNDYSKLEKAVEYGSEKGYLDNVDIAYLYVNNDIETMIESYDDIWVDMRVYFYDRLIEYIMHGPESVEVDENLKNEKDRLDYLSSLDISEEITKRLAFDLSWYVARDRVNKSILEHPFIKNNIYINYYWSLRRLGSEDTRQEALRDLNENTNYQDIDGYEREIEIINTSTYMEGILDITKEGILVYEFSGQYFMNNIYDDEESEVYPYERWGTPSNSRNYYILFTWDASKVNYLILDSELKIAKSIEAIDMLSFKWLNDTEVYEEYRRTLYNIPMGEEEKVDVEQLEFPKIDNYTAGVELYRIDEETYTVIELEVHENLKEFLTNPMKRHYRVRNIHDNSVVYEMELPVIFIGSNDNYIFGLEEQGNLLVLTSINKDTHQRTSHKFYLINDHWSWINTSYLPTEMLWGTQ